MREALYLAISTEVSVRRISLPEKILQIFLLEALLDFLAKGFAQSACNILSYLNIANLPIVFILKRFVSFNRFAIQ